MRNLNISDKTVSTNGTQPLTASIMGVTLTNSGAATVGYSWNSEDKSIQLLSGESISFGGFENYTLGGNKLFYEFGAGAAKLQITTFTIAEEIKTNQC